MRPVLVRSSSRFSSCFYSVPGISIRLVTMECLPRRGNRSYVRFDVAWFLAMACLAMGEWRVGGGRSMSLVRSASARSNTLGFRMLGSGTAVHDLGIPTPSFIFRLPGWMLEGGPAIWREVCNRCKCRFTIGCGL